MLRVPFALNIMSTGSYVWGSIRDPRSGQWTSERLISQTPQLGLPNMTFTAGAIVPALADVLNVGGESSTHLPLYFINGDPNTAVVVGAQYRFLQAPGISSPKWSRPTGPFPYAGNLFWFLEENIAASKKSLAAVASLDGGATWATQNAVNSPILHDPAFVNDGLSSLYWDGVSQFVYVFVQNPFGAVKTVSLLQFDMVAKTWSTIHTGNNEFTGTGITPEPLRTMWITVYSDGTIGLLYSLQPDANPVAIFYREYPVGGPLGVESLVRANPYTFQTVIPNNTVVPNRIEVFGYKNTTTNPVYFQVTQGAVVSADLFSFPDVGDDGFGWGVIDPQSGLIIVPFDDFNFNANAVWEAPVNGPYAFVEKFLPVPDPALDPGPHSCSMIFFGLATYNGLTKHAPINLPEPALTVVPIMDREGVLQPGGGSRLVLACRGADRCGWLTNLKSPVFARRR